MNFSSFWSDVLATALGGLGLAVILFWIKEQIAPIPHISGRWHFSVTITSTSYRPYEGMELSYISMLWVEGSVVKGTAEKTFERSSTGERAYTGPDRTRAVIDGHIEKRYFSRDAIVLHMVEEGERRQSTTFFELAVESTSTMSGTFSSMVADQSGTCRWSKT